jgi:hypothetical protein
MADIWRKCRTAFRWCRFTLWAVVLAALLAFAWLNVIGFPDFIKARLTDTLHQRGVDLQFTRMRLRLVHGLVVDNVRIGSLTDTNRPTLTAREVQLRLDYPALMHRQLQVDSAILRDGKFTLQVSPTNSLVWLNIQSDIRFLPGDTWAVDDLRSDFAGTHLQLALHVAHAPEIARWNIFAGRKAAGPSALSKPLQDFASQLQRIHFSGQPQLNLTLKGDARDVHSFNLQANVTVPYISTPWFSSRNLQFATRITSPDNTPTSGDPALSFWTNAFPFRLVWIARAADLRSERISGDMVDCSGLWLAPELKITHLGGHLGGGTLETSAGLDVVTRRLTFTNSSSFDPHVLSFFLPAAIRKPLTEILWTGPPALTIGGSTRLPAWTNSQPDWREELLASLSLTGAAGFSNAIVRGAPLDLLRTRFDYDDQILTLSDTRFEQGRTRLSLSGQRSFATKNFRLHLAGTADIETVRPFLTGTIATNIFHLVQLNEPLAFDLSAAGNLASPADTTAAGHLALTNFAVRGQTFGSVVTAVTCSNRVVQFSHPQAYRATNTQYLTADSVTLDFNQWMIFFTNGYSTFDQMVIPRAIGPKTAGAIEPYQCVSAPTARVHGQLPIRDFKTGRDLDGTDLTFDIIRPVPFRWSLLLATNMTGTVRWMGQYLILSNLNAQCYGGEARGRAYFDFTPVGYGCDFDFDAAATNINVHALALDLASDKKTNKLEGLLSGHVAVTDANSKSWQSWDGYGSLKLHDGLLWDIRLFGFMSPVLNTFAPGLGNSRATDARVDFVMTNGVARSDSLTIQTLTMRLQYAGTVDLQQNVNALVTAQLMRNTWVVGPLVSTILWPVSKISECRVTGLVSDPKVTPVIFHPIRNFLEGGSTPPATPPADPTPPK